jgi:PAS domain S-box-containing protein
LATHCAVTRVLAESAGLDEAAPRLLRVLCSELGWDVGSMFVVDDVSDRLVHVASYASPEAPAQAFLECTRKAQYRRGVGLPGRIMEDAAARWIPDVTRDDNFPRAQLAEASGLRAAAGFPIFEDDEATGVIELFARELRPPDEELLGLVSELGRPIGQFVARCRAQDALRAHRHLLESLLQAHSDLGAGYILADGERIIAVNEAYCRITGYTSEELLAMRSFFDLVAPEDQERVRARREASLTAPTVDMPAPMTVTILHKSGRRVVVESASKPFHPDRSWGAFIAIVRDVTERQRTEDALLRADRLASLGTLAAGVAHEINNPLTWVLLHLGFLDRELPRIAADLRTGDPSAQLTAAARIESVIARVAETREGVQRIEGIVRDLRTFSRPDSDVREPIDVCKVLDSAVNLTAGELRHRVVLKRDYAPIPPVLGTESRLGQLFLNLLVNAAQAIPPGDAARNQIRISTHSDGAHVLVEISDTGAGIPADVLPRVFDPFFTTRTAGVGLGLSVCHGITQSLGGQIAIDSRVGAGTTVRVLLPAVRRASNTERPRLLVVEDEQRLAGALARVLGDEFDVSLAPGRERALELLLGGARFDAILCDLLLPDGSGMELYDTLRARLPGTEVKLVFMSGGPDSPQVREFLRRVPNARIDKPFDTQELQRILRARL